MGSPLIMLSSTNEEPETIIPSTGILFPGFTRRISPGTTWLMEISFCSPLLIMAITVLACSPISFLRADEVFAFAFSSNILPSRIKVTITAEASKYTCASIPFTAKSFGKRVITALYKYAMPVLKATRVSIFEERCFSCFHAPEGN